MGTENRYKMSQESLDKLKAELEVKGIRYPIPFACAQKLNPDGSLTIKGMINV